MSYSRGYYNPSYTQSLYPSAQQHHRHPYQQELPYGMEHKSRSIFEAMEKLTMTCNGLARTLESTLMATHSGFNALLQLTHQFRTIRHSISHVFGVLSLLRWLKSKILGSRVKASTLTRFSIKEFESYNARSSSSMTPWIVMLVVSIAVPIIMQAHQQQQEAAHVKNKSTLSTGTAAKTVAPTTPTKVKPTKLDFARALYSFQAESTNELSLRPNDLIAILSKKDADWWQGRLKNGKIGYFPANHVEIIEKNIEIPSKASIAPSA